MKSFVIFVILVICDVSNLRDSFENNHCAIFHQLSDVNAVAVIVDVIAFGRNRSFVDFRLMQFQMVSGEETFATMFAFVFLLFGMTFHVVAVTRSRLELLIA